MSEFMKNLPTVLKGNSDGTKLSSKRVITFMLAFTLVSVVIANTFFNFEVDEAIYTGLVDVLIWSLGFIGSEQFAGALKKRYGGKPNTEAQLPPRPGGEEHERF
jgi:hypothetical protein